MGRDYGHVADVHLEEGWVRCININYFFTLC